MSKFFVLLDRELKSFFYSPVAYVVLCFFLIISGFNLYAMVSLLNSRQTDYTVLNAFFNNSIFWFTFLLILPLITMRLYSEEFKLGTIETLLTAPVEDWQVVAAKFGSALFFYIVLWLPTVLYFGIYQWITGLPAFASVGSIACAYLLVLLVGMFYLSIGCLASVVTRNQIIAAVISLVTLQVLFFTGLLGFIVPNISQGFRDFVAYFSTVEHMRDFSRGLIDTRAVVYYVSMTILLQFVTYQIFQFRKWKS